MNKLSQAPKMTMGCGKDSNRHSDYFTGSSNRLNEDSNAYDMPEPRSSENEYQVPSQCMKRVAASNRAASRDRTGADSHVDELANLGQRKKASSDSLKNLTVVSAASSVRSSVMQCCIKPFKMFSSHTKGVKKCLKKL